MSDDRVIKEIDDETIDNVSILAKLELDAEERETARCDLGRMLAYIEKMNELDTDGVEPLSHPNSVPNVSREDDPSDRDGTEDSLKNAPLAKDGMYQVPPTFDR